MNLFDFEEEKIEVKARYDYNLMLGEGVLEETAGILLAEKYGGTVAKRIVNEMKGWD